MRLIESSPVFLEFGPNSDGQKWVRGLKWKCLKCGFPVQIEFRPLIGPSPARSDSLEAMEKQPVSIGQPIWHRLYGETFDTLCISPSINHGPNGDCRITIYNGEIL